MTDTIKISELESASAITSNDILPIVQNGETKKITASNLLKDTYSTNETLTNKVWFGRPVYRKVVLTTMECNGTLEHGINDISEIVDLKVIFQSEDEYYSNSILPKNCVNEEYTIAVDNYTNTTVTLTCGSYYEDEVYDFTFIFEYTKID